MAWSPAHNDCVKLWFYLRNLQNSSAHTNRIRDIAAGLGFDHCGIARAARLDDDARRLESWLNKGMHGSMSWMENHFELRIDPARLVPGARSVITLLLNYYPDQLQTNSSYKISKYAYGADYHEVIRSKLNAMLTMMRAEMGDIAGRGFVDSAPVLERSWAQRSGVGWIGKSGNLINRSGGTFFFIATLITDLELEYDEPVAHDFCGSCTKCIDACPTEAILEDRLVDGSKCISYFTIELRDALIPEKMEGKFDDWIFGCDTCQDVCPWNRFAKPSNDPALKPLPEVLNLSTSAWEDLSEEAFKEIFRSSPVRRTKFEGIRRNIRFVGR